MFDYGVPTFSMILLLATFYRPATQRFSAFRAYILYDLLAIPALMVIYPLSYRAYFYSYWFVSFGRRIMTLAVLYQLARVTYSQDKPLRIAGWAAAALSLALVIALTFIPMGHGVLGFFRVVDRATTLLVCAVYLSTSLFASALGFYRRKDVLGISLGLALLSGLNLLYASTVHLLKPYALHNVPPCTYLLAVSAWLYTLSRNPVKKPIASAPMMVQVRSKVIAMG
jgi:hypothetical protein